MKTDIHFFITSRSFRQKLWRKSKHIFMFNNIFFFENRTVYGVMWKNYRKAGQAIDDNMAHAFCLLDN